MKKTLLFVLLVFGVVHLSAQGLQNNPVENVIYDGVIIDEGFISSIPEMELTRESAYRILPNSVDNSTRIFMPPIFDQRNSGSCTQCAEIGYVLTYELNRYRNSPAEVFWTDIVTSQPEGYVVDDNGNIHIHSAEALAWLSAVSNGMYGNEATNFEDVTIILENDIDLAEAKWTPIAGINNDGSFNGKFDGKGHVINHIVLTENPSYYNSTKGFFCNLDNATIENVIFRNAYYEGRGAAGILAYNADNSSINQCFFECDFLISEGEMSPLIYEIHETTISNCMLHIPSFLDENEVHSNAIYSYGIGNVQDNSHIYNCAIIIDKSHLAWNESIGFVRWNATNCKIENCYIHIKSLVDSPIPVGGTISRNGIASSNFGTIRNCYFNRDIYIDGFPDDIIHDFDDEAVSNNDGIVENTYYYFNENDYWQLNESIVYNENTTDNLIEALNLGVERLNNEGYSCLNWSDTGMDFDNMGLPVFENFKNITGIAENTSSNISVFPNPAQDFVKISAVGSQPSVVKVYNCLGMLVEEFEMTSEEIEINVSDYNPGVYFFNVNGETFRIIRN